MKRIYKYIAKFAIVIGPSLLIPLGATETIEDYRPLLNNSPFLSKAFKDRLSKSDAAGINSYQFVGYTQIGETWNLCLINKKTKLATWVEEGKLLEGYTLVSFSPKNKEINFEKDGITAILKIESPK